MILFVWPVVFAAMAIFFSVVAIGSIIVGLVLSVIAIASSFESSDDESDESDDSEHVEACF